MLLKRVFVRWLMVVAASAFVVFGGYAQPAALLTPTTVANFVESYPQVKAKANELRAQYDVPGNPSEAAAWRDWAGADAAKGQLDTVVRAFGFSDFPEWVRVLSVTAQSYAFTQGGADLNEKIADALARVESNDSLPEAKKEMMRQQLKHSAAAIAAMKPSQENIDAVMPYVEQLKELFDDEG